MENRKSFFHLHLISDSTGETLISAGRAASAQFRSAMPIEHVYPLIRNRQQLSPVLAHIDEMPGIVLYTIVDQSLADYVDQQCKELGVPAVNLLEPVLATFQAYLGSRSRRRVGAQHVLNADYFRRIEALDFAMDHDDGQMHEEYDEADVVIVGISRTSKNTHQHLPGQSRHQGCQCSAGARNVRAARHSSEGNKAFDCRPDSNNRRISQVKKIVNSVTRRLRP